VSKPKIYILSPDSDIPCGGIKQLYRHADVLNNNGFEAFIIHAKENFRCTWFENNTRISYLTNAVVRKSDYLVVPEIYGELLSEHKEVGGTVKELEELINFSENTVIFNQGCYLTFKGYSMAENNINPFMIKNSVIAVMVVSEDSKQYMHYAFPRIKVFRVHNSINSKLFFYQHEKKKQICFMTRRLQDDIIQVINILKYRDALGGFKLIPIENRTEREVAEIMKESLIFLSFSYQEGCPLPPMEAMACGCLVIGYDGRGGREYFGKEFSYAIEGGDIINFARTVEEIIIRRNKNNDTFDRERQEASEYIKKNYSMEREAEDILRCWTQIITEYGSQYEKEQGVFRLNKHGDEELINGKFLACYYGLRDKILPHGTKRRAYARSLWKIVTRMIKRLRKS
jgi:hypothetical protein